jgi:hypothetical protein
VAKVSGVLDLFGAVILLSALAVVANKPGVVTGTLRQFNTILKTAKA